MARTSRIVQAYVPDAVSFRDWLARSLRQLDVSAHRVTEIAELGPNTVRRFLVGSNRDITLTTANKIVTACQKISEEMGRDLPALKAPLIEGKPE